MAVIFVETAAVNQKVAQALRSHADRRNLGKSVDMLREGAEMAERF